MKCFDENSLNHVFYQVMRLHYKRTHYLLDKSGVYPGQPPLLFSLYHKNGQSQKDLACKLNIKPATMTVMIKRMEKAELIKRKGDSKDQRISRVYITEKGKEVCESVKVIIDQIQDECLSNFTKEEEVLLRRLLLQVKDNLVSVTEE